jgi:hypothetical protein
MKLTRRPVVPKKLRKRTRRSVAQRQAGKLNGFELNVLPEEIMSDLNFGVGSLWKTAQIPPERGVRAGGPHESN